MALDRKYLREVCRTFATFRFLFTLLLNSSLCEMQIRGARDKSNWEDRLKIFETENILRTST